MCDFSLVTFYVFLLKGSDMKSLKNFRLNWQVVIVYVCGDSDVIFENSLE